MKLPLTTSVSGPDETIANEVELALTVIDATVVEDPVSIPITPPATGTGKNTALAEFGSPADQLSGSVQEPSTVPLFVHDV